MQDYSPNKDIMFNNLFNRNADQLVKKAIDDYEKGKDEFQVIKNLQKALKMGVKNYPLDKIYLHIGASYFDLALYEKAQEAYEKGLEYNRRNHSLLSNLGLTYQKLGDFEKSIPYYELSLEVNPNNSYAHHNIGLYLYETGKHFEAIESLDRAVQINPGLAVSYAVKARSLAYLGKYIESKKYHKQAIKNGYDNGKILKNELEEIEKENPKIYYDQTKFSDFLSLIQIPKEQIEEVLSVTNEPYEFYKQQHKVFEEFPLSAFDIENALHWYYLVFLLRDQEKVLTVEEDMTSDEIQDGLKTILRNNQIEIGNSLDEFELAHDSDAEEIFYSIASKLKLKCSVELLSIWLGGNQLIIYPMATDRWQALNYPYSNVEDGFGVISPIASGQSIENWLLNK